MTGQVWRIRAAEAEDMPAINQLVSSADGDLYQLNVQEFLVAADAGGAILGCGRLRPYPDFCELASLAVNQSVRTQGVGRAVVAGLLELYAGEIYLVCEDNVVEFFRRLGFRLIPQEDMPDGLRPKWQYFVGRLGTMNVMVRG